MILLLRAQHWKTAGTAQPVVAYMGSATLMAVLTRRRRVAILTLGRSLPLLSRAVHDLAKW